MELPHQAPSRSAQFRRQVFLVDTHVNYDPSANELVEITVLAAEEMRRFGVAPKAALLSHSSFGSSNQPSAIKMREALALVQASAPWLEVDGEMHGDAAIDAVYRKELMPRSTLGGEAIVGASRRIRRLHAGLVLDDFGVTVLGLADRGTRGHLLGHRQLLLVAEFLLYVLPLSITSSPTFSHGLPMRPMFDAMMG
jgi:Phosphate acetyl/butaryl transferase